MKFVYGLSKTGLSIINYFNEINDNYIVWDDDKEIRKSINKSFNKINFQHPNEIDISKIQEAYISSGINLNNKNLEKLKKNGISIYRDLELYSKLLSNQKVIAITGTNGKSTTTKLIGDIFISNNIDCFVGGNIGKPLINFFNDKDQSKYHVIELSSYQLESAPSFSSFISILLNISNDHLDRYQSMEKYVQAKRKILNKENNNYNIISVDDDNTSKIFYSSNYNKNIAISYLKPLEKGIYYCENNIHDNYFQSNEIIPIKKLSASLLGSFNLQNIIAAYAVVKILNLNVKNYLNVIAKFKGLPHRLEQIYKNEKLLIINNSKSTNLDSAINSILNFDNICLILGGLAKDNDFSILLKFKKNIYKCYLIGQSTNLIYDQISHDIESIKSFNLENAVEQIFDDIKNSKKKMTILLSPGCASFDQFNSYESRGNEFKNLIENEIKKIKK